MVGDVLSLNKIKLFFLTLIITIITSSCLYGANNSVQNQDIYQKETSNSKEGVNETNQKTGEMGPEKILSMCNGKDEIEIKEIWEPLGINSKLYDFNKGSGKKKVEAEKTEVDLDGVSGLDCIISLSVNQGQYWQFLIFINNGDSFNYAGSVDFPIKQNGGKPAYRIVQADNNYRWLVVQAKTGSGTGFSRNDEFWYRIDGGKLKQDLSYILKLVSAQRPEIDLATQFEGQVIKSGYVDNNFTIEVKYRIKYVINPIENDLVPIEKQYQYIWNPSQKCFTEHTETKEARKPNEEEELFNNLPDLFLQNNYTKLINIASQGNEEKKKWIVKLLDNCSPGHEKEHILELVNNSQINVKNEQFGIDIKSSIADFYSKYNPQANIWAIKLDEPVRTNFTSKGLEGNDYLITAHVQTDRWKSDAKVALVLVNKDGKYTIAYNHINRTFQLTLTDINADNIKELVLEEDTAGNQSTKVFVTVYKYDGNNFHEIFYEGLSECYGFFPYWYENTYRFVKSKSRPGFLDIAYNIETTFDKTLLSKRKEYDKYFSSETPEVYKDEVLFIFDGEKYVPSKALYPYRRQLELFLLQ